MVASTLAAPTIADVSKSAGGGEASIAGASGVQESGAGVSGSGPGDEEMGGDDGDDDADSVGSEDSYDRAMKDAAVDAMAPVVVTAQ